jgi:hypothetical protein
LKNSPYVGPHPWGSSPAGNLGRYPNETCRRQIQPIYEGLDEADGILCTDIVVQALGQEECLAVWQRSWPVM